METGMTSGQPTGALALAHIEEGKAYVNGEVRELYPTGAVQGLDMAASSVAAAEAVVFAQCHDLSIGPLAVRACIDLPALTFTVEVKLLGVVLGRCEVSPQNQQCRIGGSVDGFKAEVVLELDLDGPALCINAQVCVPVLGCRKFGPICIP